MLGMIKGRINNQQSIINYSCIVLNYISYIDPRPSVRPSPSESISRSRGSTIKVFVQAPEIPVQFRQGRLPSGISVGSAIKPYARITVLREMMNKKVWNLIGDQIPWRRLEASLTLKTCDQVCCPPEAQTHMCRHRSDKECEQHNRNQDTSNKYKSILSAWFLRKSWRIHPWNECSTPAHLVIPKTVSSWCTNSGLVRRKYLFDGSHDSKELIY